MKILIHEGTFYKVSLMIFVDWVLSLCYHISVRILLSAQYICVRAHTYFVSFLLIISGQDLFDSVIVISFNTRFFVCWYHEINSYLSLSLYVYFFLYFISWGLGGGVLLLIIIEDFDIFSRNFIASMQHCLRWFVRILTHY